MEALITCPLTDSIQPHGVQGCPEYSKNEAINPIFPEATHKPHQVAVLSGVQVGADENPTYPRRDSWVNTIALEWREDERAWPPNIYNVLRRCWLVEHCTKNVWVRGWKARILYDKIGATSTAMKTKSIRLVIRESSRRVGKRSAVFNGRRKKRVGKRLHS